MFCTLKPVKTVVRVRNVPLNAVVAFEKVATLVPFPVKRGDV